LGEERSTSEKSSLYEKERKGIVPAIAKELERDCAHGKSKGLRPRPSQTRKSVAKRWTNGQSCVRNPYYNEGGTPPPFKEVAIEAKARKSVKLTMTKEVLRPRIRSLWGLFMYLGFLYARSTLESGGGVIKGSKEAASTPVVVTLRFGEGVRGVNREGTYGYKKELLGSPPP